MLVAALAGRRVDVPGSSTVSFPAAHIERVRTDVERVLREERVELLVSSAAAGADIVGLQAAQKLKIRCRVILPFNVERFRTTSVVDRSNEWGQHYDQIIADVDRSGELHVLDSLLPDAEAYSWTTKIILDEAIAAAIPDRPVALAVWDDNPRDSQDFTNEFRLLARNAGFRERVVSTR